MAFEIFTELFSGIETATQIYVTNTSTTVIAMVTPFISIGLTIAFTVYGVLVMRGTIEMPVSGFLSRCLRISIIISIAITSGLYQKDITKIITDTPTALLGEVIKSFLPTANHYVVYLIKQLKMVSLMQTKASKKPFTIKVMASFSVFSVSSCCLQQAS